MTRNNLILEMKRVADEETAAWDIIAFATDNQAGGPCIVTDIRRGLKEPVGVVQAPQTVTTQRHEFPSYELALTFIHDRAWMAVADFVIERVARGRNVEG